MAPFVEFDHDGNVIRWWGAGLVTYAHDETWAESGALGAHNGVT